MRLGQLSIVLRNVFLLFCIAALSGYTVLRAERAPEDAAWTVVALGIAEVPSAVADTFRDLFDNPFADSLTPDDFANSPGFVPVVNRTHHRVEGLVLRRGDGEPQDGWRLIYGIFRIDGQPQYAVLALAPDLSITHIWTIGDDVLVRESFSVGQAPYPHGFALLADGSMLVEFEDVFLPLHIDRCGRRIWSGDAIANHAINSTDDGRFAWSVGQNSALRLFDLANGKSVRAITVDELRRANPDLTVFDLRLIDDNALGANPKNDALLYFDDPYHLNDVDPLPSALAPRFPEFAAGDLLISARSLNLVMVVDPHTLKVKWFSNDFTLRQHDPDWEASGRISVLDNQNGRSFSRIVEFDPANGTHSVLVDGSRYQFYTRIRGKQQQLPGGGNLITSSEQGRIFQLDPQGRVAFDMLDRDPANPGRNFVVSQANWYDLQAPAVIKAMSCPVS